MTRTATGPREQPASGSPSHTSKGLGASEPERPGSLSNEDSDNLKNSLSQSKQRSSSSSDPASESSSESAWPPAVTVHVAVLAKPA